MAPFVKDLAPLSAASTLVAGNKSDDPFSQAIDQVLAELEEGADAKNPFLKEIKGVHQRLIKADDGKDQSMAAVDDLKKFVQDLEEQKQAHRRQRVLKRLTPFIESLSKLMGLCESLLEAAPFGVSVAFTGARVVLGLAVHVSNCFDSIVDGIEEIGISLKCYEKFADAFRKSTDMQELLVSSYKRIIQFWVNVSRILSTSRLKGAVKSLVAPIDKEVKAALDGLKRDGDRVSILAQATTAQQTEREREATRRAGIVRWITSDSPVDVRINLRVELERHQAGTCQWVLDDQRFKDWSKSEENAVLWYHAKPGSGKTVLAASVIENLRKQGQNVVYFFYSFNSPRRKKGISGLRSLALQLLHLAQFVPQTLQDRFDTELGLNIGGLHDQSTAVATVHDLLKHGCADVCIVVDGLDECSDEAQTLLSFRNLLGLETYGVLKWFFTSRDHPQIRATMEKCKAREMKAEPDHISQDIRAYLSEYITCKKCITRWSEGEDNFLYARLICETLRGEGLTSDEEIDQALMSYPKDLNGYYMRVLDKLGEKSELEQERARRTFLFLVAAAQSVSLNEVLDFLGITTGARDHDPKRIPFIDSIRNLCSPLIVFDKPGQGDEVDNPLLKLCHQTVEEFFRQNPEDLDLGSAKLRKYFVTSQQANQRIGLDCLTYLQYGRYQKTEFVHNLDPILRKPVPREHAFLAYAATFWAQHLDFVSPTPEIYQAVKKFLCSPAFWTCLAVQTRVGRYLFGRYIGSNSSQYKMGIRGSRARGDDSFGLPLPRWLDRYSLEGLMLDRSMCYFVDEWREVLLTCAEGLQSCLPLRVCEPSCHLYALEKPRHCRVAPLSQGFPDPRPVGECRLLGVEFNGKTAWADLLYQDRSHQGRYQYLRTPLFTPKKDMTSKRKKITKDFDGPPVNGDLRDWNWSFRKSGDGTEALGAWKADPETLSLRRSGPNVSERYEIPSAVPVGSTASKNGSWATEWAQEVAGTTGPVQIAHLKWRLREMSPVQDNGRTSTTATATATATERDNDESDEDTDTSEDEDDDTCSMSSSDNDTDANSSGIPQSTAESSNGASSSGSASSTDSDPITDCLLVAPSEGKPSWMPWSSSQRIWSRVLPATHPTLGLVVVTHTTRQLEVVDLAQGTRRTKLLPEPLGPQETSLASVRELRFSPCAKYLHFLQMSFYPQKGSTEVHITMSTYSFHAEGGGDEALIRHSEARGYKYSFGETLADVALPLCLTSWSDNEVVIALPPLTCDAKIIKIELDTDPAVDTPVCTLRAPIYFPTSTPRRKARLIYRGSQGAKSSEYLCLVLDTVAGVEQAGEGEAGLQMSGPVVLRWKIGELGGWREWEEEQDGTASDLKRGMSAWQLLKGDFVDNDKYFSVPIRSGLDWTRKGHLSCAAY